MFAWFALCFFLQPTRLSPLFLRFTQLKNGALQVQEQNVAVVVHEKTQLAVFPFVEFARNQRSCVHCGLCFYSISSVKAGNSDDKLSSLYRRNCGKKLA